MSSFDRSLFMLVFGGTLVSIAAFLAVMGEQMRAASLLFVSIVVLALGVEAE